MNIIMSMVDISIHLTDKDHITIGGGYNRSSGEKRTNTGTKTFDHTPQQRTESWGTKN